MYRRIFTLRVAILLGIGMWGQLLFWGHSATATVTYRLDFDGSWSLATHPGAFPGSGSHFTRLVGGTHSDAVTFWEVGALATPGIESVAEVGGTSVLLAEVQNAITAGTAKSTLLGPGLFSLPSNDSFSFSMEPSHPLVTLTSMVAPSPDWFVGVSALSLREDGAWLGQVEIALSAYDAGTEEGEAFSLSNPSTFPQEVIKELTQGPLAGSPPLGTLTFTIQPNDLAGDFNLDGIVNEENLRKWEEGFDDFADASALVVDGDANGDGRVNAADFLIWQQNYGSFSAAATAALSVPESHPIGLLLLGLIILSVTGSDRKRADRLCRKPIDSGPE